MAEERNKSSASFDLKLKNDVRGLDKLCLTLALTGTVLNTVKSPAAIR